MAQCYGEVLRKAAVFAILKITFFVFPNLCDNLTVKLM
jgi:hypothetical protein